MAGTDPRDERYTITYFRPLNSVGTAGTAESYMYPQKFGGSWASGTAQHAVITPDRLKPEISPEYKALMEAWEKKKKMSTFLDKLVGRGKYADPV